MMKPEQAQKELEKLRKPDWLEINLRELSRLPDGLRAAGRGLLGRHSDDEHAEFGNWQQRQQAHRRAVAKLAQEAAKHRQKLFAVLFPRLESQVEAGWQLNARLPYQVNYGRKAFRAPRHPKLTLLRTGTWLEALSTGVGGYEQDVTWWAAWAGHHVGYNVADALGLLFAASINAGDKTGDEVFDILCASGKNEHEIGRMGRHVSRALLTADRADGWEFIEKMLLAAQRQEGLRQVILESIDEAHPEAFRRMLRLILDHDLARFSAVVRAVDVWFGFGWDSVSTRVVNEALQSTLNYLEDDAARHKAIQSGEGDDLYLALWTLAFEDAVAAVEAATPLLQARKVERRFIATHLLGQLGLAPALKALLPALADDDLRVAWRALRAFQVGHYGDDGDEDAVPAVHTKDLFERLEKLIERLPDKGVDLKALVWPWMAQKAQSRDILSTLTANLGDRPPTRLLPYLRRMDGWAKQAVIDRLGQQKKWDAQTRETLFGLVGDTNASVRERAVQALAKCKISEDEAGQLEALLTRKANDLRRGVLGLLLKQKDDHALASAERLLASADKLQRLAGLEMLRELAAAKRQAPQCQARATHFKNNRPRLTAEELRAVDAIVESSADKPTLDNALGLLDPAQRTPPTPPKKRDVHFVSPAAAALLRSLDDLIHEHREQEVVFRIRPQRNESDDDVQDAVGSEPEERQSKPMLLGQVTYGFPLPDPTVPVAVDLVYLPLVELWQKWWVGRPTGQRDRDGMELSRAQALLQAIEQQQGWDRASAGTKQVRKLLFGDGKWDKLRYPQLLAGLLPWLMRLYPPPNAADFLLDAVETSFALVPAEELTKVRRPGANRWDVDYDADWRESYRAPFLLWHGLATAHRHACPQDWNAKHHVRLYQLDNWKDLGTPGMGRSRPDFDTVLNAYLAGGATQADLFDLILGPPDANGYSQFGHLATLTVRKPHEPWLKKLPELQTLGDRCRQRILEIELRRGDTPTAASGPALALGSVWGVNTLLRILQALGKDTFHRGYSYRENLSKACVLTHLAAVSFPAEGDSPETFAAGMREAGIPDDRLIELAFKAPQWVKYVEHTLGWEGFSEGVWWFLAHTRDSGQAIDKAWRALLSERTALSPEELREGAVDVAWFHRAHQAVGPKRWLALDEAAKYASMAGGYRRAKFLASVLLGKAKRKDLIAGIQKKFLKESVRALGLLPLAVGGRDRDVQERYGVLTEYHRYARGLSALSREAAVKAAEVGLANLARTAGYPDPLRFQWAMEAAGCADLRAGVTARAADVEVSLAVDAQGQVQWTVLRQGKPVKSVPTAQGKDAKIAALVDRKKELARAQARMRRGLEDMMCRGDTFSAAELVQLMNHPLLAPLLGRLVIVGEGILGYPVKKGQALCDHAGKLEPVKKSETLRLAHPCDLLASGQWHEWQRECFANERVQPFKQVFRELYVVTAAEKKEGELSRRYAGQQVQPRQASALWASRGWSVSESEGIRKTFHELGLTAWVGFQWTAGTAAEVEGWTLEAVGFARARDHQPLQLKDLPPRLFSEIMRDMDLVVSVAHRGGVDPEASASTVEMRGNLLRELCHLVKLDNVRQKKQHVLIDGQLGQYSVHLGSGGVHRLPGGALFVVPIHAQHRGRLFLPFADDDPKTAEILSKVLLLARDQDIQDPSILDQLKAR